MIDVALLSVIQRWHLRDKISIREIARRTKLSRNTIAKYLASGETSPRIFPFTVALLTFTHRGTPSGVLAVQVRI